MRGIWLGAAIAAFGASSANAEAPAFYAACDGYGAPNENGDGMTTEAKGFLKLFGPGRSSGNTRRSTPPLGGAGVLACDKALHDPRLEDRYWLRRASLLRARAIHDLAIRDNAAAARDLDAAVAALREPDDPYVRRSMTAGIALVRAFQIRVDKGSSTAVPLVAPLWADRPLNRQFGFGILAALGGGDPVLNNASLLQGMARIEPRMIGALYAEAFDRRDFAQVILLAEQVTAPDRTTDVGTSWGVNQVQAAQNKSRAMYVLAEQQGMLAYAHAVSGRQTQAQAILDKAEGDISQRVPELMPPLAAGEKEGYKGRTRRDINALLSRTGVGAKARIGTWRTFLAMRDLISKEPPSIWEPKLASMPVPPPAVAYDLMVAARSRAGLIPAEPVLVGAPPVLNQKQVTRELASLFDALPHAEIASRIPAFQALNFWHGNGFKVKTNPSTAITTVEFTSSEGSQSVVEELALLRVAKLAQEAGRDGFVILGRRDYALTTTTTMYGVALRTDPSGYTTLLDVELIDSATLPTRFRNASWRVISADQVVRLLEPTYIQSGLPTAN